MGGDPHSEILVRNTDHGPSAFSATKAVCRERTVVHHPVNRGAANSKLSLNLDGSY
jgi:hypothetical protein